MPSTSDAPPRLGAAQRLPLFATSAIVLNLSYAPFDQFYLAWLGLVPWLLALRGSGSSARAFGWAFVGAVMFNAIAISWMPSATIAGALLLMLYLSVFWAVAGAIIWRSGCLDPQPGRSRMIGSIVLIAAAWTGAEWFRGWLTAFPWMFLGQTQSLILPMCQIADIGGVFAISFWVMCINALITLLLIARISPSPSTRGEGRGEGSAAACLFVIGVVALVFVYGWFRLRQEDVFTPGPRVMVVQSSFHHARGGARTVTWEELVDFHFKTTEDALAKAKQIPDLIAWSETVVPAMNVEARKMATNPWLAHEIHEDLLRLVYHHQTSLIFGAYSLLSFTGSERDADVRNSAYLYSAFRADQPRYDKIHLVPYGESVPFRDSVPWLHNLLFKFAASSVSYLITPGSIEHMTIFGFPAKDGSRDFRCVTPICFEDVDGALIARMIRPDSGDTKRADFILNITNDGWFGPRTKWQHLQSAIFRSIENRVPTARADNTGVSGFVDSNGRVDEATLLRPDVVGTSTKQLMLDRRVTVYTHVGDTFAVVCAVVAVVVGLVSFSWSGREQPSPQPSP